MPWTLLDTTVRKMVHTADNTTKVYHALDEQMTTYHDKDDKLGQAEEIAHDLIKHADLPLLIRCCALWILGCSEKGNYVHYADRPICGPGRHSGER